MNFLLDRLLTLQVADAMSKGVVTVSSHETMVHAAEKLLQCEVSGAPVVDEQQRCVGMLSAMDFVKMHRGADERPGLGGAEHELTRDPGGTLQIEIPTDVVERHMSPSVQAVPETAHLLTAARIMCAEHIHRLPVLDEHGRPVGIITALDIVAAVVNAVDERSATAGAVPAAMRSGVDGREPA